MKKYEDLKAVNPATCDETAFEGWSAESLWALADQERRSVREGHPLRNHLDAHWRLATASFDQTGAVGGVDHDLAGERERARVDGARVALQVCQWVLALKSALTAKPDLPTNLWPRFPTIVKAREYIRFRPSGAPFDLEAWCQEHEAALLDTSKVRVVNHEGRLRLRVRPLTLGDADLVIARQHMPTICRWVEDQFVDVDGDALRGLMRAA